MDKEFIKKFIAAHALPSIKTRAIAIYQDQKLKQISVDSANQMAVYKVQGTKIYSVVISNFSTKKLKINCNCPYDWSDLCKHGLAALYHLEKNYSRSNNNSQMSTQKFKRKPSEYVEIINAENFTIETLKDYHFEKRAYNLSSSVSILNFSENKLHVIVSNHFDNTKIEVVKKKNKYFINSNANNRINSSLKPFLFNAEYEFLKYVAENNTNFFLKIFNPELKESIIQNLTERFGLNSVEDIDKYFNFYYDIKQVLMVSLKDRYKSLMPLEDTDRSMAFKESLISAVEIKKPEVPPLKQFNKKYYLGFVFINNFDEFDHPYSQIMVLKGTLPKNKKGLIKISEYEFTEDASYTNITENQVKILELLSNYNELKAIDNEDGMNANAIHSKLKNIIALLRNEDYVFYHSDPEDFDSYYNKILKRELVELILFKDLVAHLSFKVQENEGLIEAVPVFKTKETILETSKNNSKVASFGLFIIDNYLYVANSFADYKVYEQFKENPLTMLSHYKEEFITQYVMPISQKWNLEFDEALPYTIEKEYLEPLKKQVFLSEEDDYLIITPQVQYENDIQTKLLERQDFLKKEGNKITQQLRDTKYENDFLDSIGALHKELEEQKDAGYFYIHLDLLLKDMWFFNFFDHLKKQDVEVFGLKELKKFKYSTHKAKVQTNVSSGEDWFDVDLKLSFGNENISLKDIRKAIVNKDKYIKLADDSVGILPEEWVAKMQDYFRHGEVKGNQLKISKLKLSIIDELFEDIDETEILEEIAAKKKLLLSFKEIENVNLPKGINASLRAYQKEGLNWLHFLKKMKWGGILADDMGLGKTLQMICLLQGTVKDSKLANLIVVPTTLLFNWKAELEKFAPKLNAHFHYGLNRENDKSIFKKHQIIITTYGTMTRDIEFLTSYKFNYIVIDESQAIKNPNSQRYKASALLKANAKIALTGTPIENNTFDLYAQMNFVNPGFLGTMKSFKDNYSLPIDRDGDKDAAAELQKMISPFLLRRTKEQVATELPPKTEDILYCEMLPVQQKIYDAHKNEYKNQILEKIESDGLNKSKLFVLAALTKLRQICDSPLLLKDEHINTAESAKIKLLLNHIKEKTAQHKILVFSQFTSMLALIKEELDQQQIEYEYLDGKSTQKSRQNSVENFQNNKDLRVFLISLKAGGTGLNLTEADYVYIVDPWWNPAVENQAIDRCYRIGQNKSVMAYRMICKGTIEEKIVKLQDKKKQLASDIIQTDEKIMKTIDKSSLMDLFS